MVKKKALLSIASLNNNDILYRPSPMYHFKLIFITFDVIHGFSVKLSSILKLIGFCITIPFTS